MSFVPPGDPRRTQEPWLIWDNRVSLNAQNKPGLHALICGASGYPNLPGPGQPLTESGLQMPRLSSTSLSAYLMLDWLVRTEQSGQLHLPLATCRVLLTPTNEELAKAPPLGNTDQPYRPTMSQLGAPGCSSTDVPKAAEFWRSDASTSEEAATLFYFAGHGIQRSRGDQIMLLDSFGAGGRLLQHAVDTVSLRSGMAPSAKRPQIARTQFYFIDACRNLPPEVLSYQQLQANWIFDVDESGLDDRRAPIFFAAPPGSSAQAVPNEQTLFGIALLRCLNGEAAVPPRDDGTDRETTNWHVTSQSLNRGLGTVLNDLNLRLGGRQTWIADGFGEDAVLCYLNRPPIVPVQFMVEPGVAVPATRVRVASMMNPAAGIYTFPDNGSPHPYRQELAAGQYELEAIVNPPYLAQKRSCPIEPLGSRVWKLKVGL